VTEALSIPQVIVAAEQDVFDLLARSGTHWDLQHRVETLGQMWDDLSNGRLAQSSSVLVFSDLLVGEPGELETTIAAMAPHAAVFVVIWQPEDLGGLLERVAEALIQQGSNPEETPVFVLPSHDGRELMDMIRDAVGDQIAFPAEWNPSVDGPVYVPVEETSALAPEPEPVYEEAPAPVEFAPVAVPMVPVGTPVALAPVPMPVITAPAYTPPPAPAVHAPVILTPAPVAVQTPAYATQGSAGSPPVTNGADPGALPPRPGQVTITVTSSKGGSGKSTTAMMLAAQIAHSSRLAGKPLKVVLVDMDTRDGQVASLIGHYKPTALNIRVSPQWDEETILKYLVHEPKLGIDALLAPVRPRTADDVGPDFYQHVIRMLQRTHDVVIMDTSVNYLDPLISTVCLPEATAVLFVTTLATTSVQGMARALREITEPVENGGMGINRKKIGIVVNQSVTGIGMEPDQVIQAALKVQIVGAIPLATKHVLMATNSNSMHKLLKHPMLGPAYHSLAQACLKGVDLPPVIEGSVAGPPQSAPAQGPAQQPQPDAAANDGTAKKRFGFGKGR
jgi:cellulose biosynthesis protein BcsQ